MVQSEKVFFEIVERAAENTWVLWRRLALVCLISEAHLQAEGELSAVIRPRLGSSPAQTTTLSSSSGNPDPCQQAELWGWVWSSFTQPGCVPRVLCGQGWSTAIISTSVACPSASAGFCSAKPFTNWAEIPSPSVCLRFCTSSNIS